MSDLSSKKIRLGLSIPIKQGSEGYFEQSYDTFTQIKSNIINLLNTIPGERRMQPLFGSRLHTVVFEQNTDILPEIIGNIVKEDISKWISNVTVENVYINVDDTGINTNNRDIYKLHIVIDFRIGNTNELNSMTMTFEKPLI